MLPGQDFRRRHQRRLIAVGDAHQHRVQRDDRLAAADVALQQPVHRHVAGHVGGHFADRRLLARRQLERQPPANAGVDLGRGRQRRRPKAELLLPAPGHDGQLQHEQLLKHEPPPRPGQFVRVLRGMDRRQRLGERHQVELREQRRRKNLFQHRRQTARPPPRRFAASATATMPSVSE